MKFIAITANPEEHSLTNAAGRAWLDGARAQGATTDFLWLDGEGFRPEYTAADQAHYLGKAPIPSDVAALQARIADADALALCFPIYWYTMPAMMKGFFDRVLCRGFAYDGATGMPLALAGKSVRMLMPAGGSEQWFKDSGTDTALRLQICEHTLRKYCGVSDSDLVYLGGLSSGDESEEAHELGRAQLARVRESGAQLCARLAGRL